MSSWETRCTVAGRRHRHDSTAVRWVVHARAAAVLVLALLLLLSPHRISADDEAPPDESPPGQESAAIPYIDLVDGRFFFTAEREGYAIVDEPGGPAFWAAYRRLGGVAGLGAPISRPFGLPDGGVYQATGNALLVWHPGTRQTEAAGTLEMLRAAGLDDWLWAHGVPRAERVPAVTGAEGTLGDAFGRVGWLTDPAIRLAYFGDEGETLTGFSTGLARYGLPASLPERFDGQVTQRFERGALRVLVEASGTGEGDDSGAAHALPVAIGDLLRESGLLGGAALASDRLVGGRLVARAPRPQLAWRSDTGWGGATTDGQPYGAIVSAAEATPAAPAAPAAQATSAVAAPPTIGTATPTPAPGTGRFVESPAGPAPTATSIPPGISASAGAGWTPTATAALPQPGASLVVRAVVNQGRTEHVVIANEGTTAQELTGWLLRSASGGQTYAFPNGFVLAPGAVVNVHSGSGDPAVLQRPPTDLFATRSNIWRNEGDVAQLVEPRGRVVAEKRYGTP